MSEPTRATTGGFEPRFVVTRTDGTPIPPDRRYVVLDGSGADPAAYWALRLYAEMVRGQDRWGEMAERFMRVAAAAMSAVQRITPNQALADDLNRLLSGPDSWPATLAQHADAR